MSSPVPKPKSSARKLGERLVHTVRRKWRLGGIDKKRLGTLARRISRHVLIEKPRAKRVFHYDTYEAHVYVFRDKTKRGATRKRRIFRDGQEKREEAVKRFFLHTILHEAFPQNAIVPIDVRAMAPYPGAKKHWGMVSEVVKGRSREYRQHHRWDYTRHHMIQVPRVKDPPGYTRHIEWVEQHGAPLVKEIKRKTGIEVSSMPRNIINSRNTPVFVEVLNCSRPALFAFLRQNHQLRERVFGQMKPYIPWYLPWERAFEHVLEKAGPAE